MINPNYLAIKNAHPRDKLVTFEEVGHKYTVDGDDDYMSVTTWNHKHFEEFNPDAAIKMMKKQGRNSTPLFCKETTLIIILFGVIISSLLPQTTARRPPSVRVGK